MLYDLIIIGTGPAGIAAAIYAIRREMKVLLVGKELGGQLIWAGDIENYPGFSNISNFDLIQNFKQQLKTTGVEPISAEVKEIRKRDDNSFELFTDGNVYEARAVIVAMGLVPRRLAIAGETAFNGKGVSYCANCDAPLYKNKQVGVIGGGNAALDAAEVLSKIAKKVFLIIKEAKISGFEALEEELQSRENVEIKYNTQLKEITGEGRVENISIVEAGVDKTMPIDGIFIEIGRIAHTDLVKEFVDLDETNQIVVDKKCQTKTPGLFAAGDVTDSEFKQITVAVGEGTIAALAAYQYVQSTQGKKIERVVDRSIHK